MKAEDTGYIILALLVVSIATAGFFYFKYSEVYSELLKEKRALEEAGERVNLPITHDKAIEIALSDEDFSTFAEEHFKEPELRIERAALEFNEVTGKYLWRVEIMERACGCAGLGNISAMVFLIDPESGAILKKEERVGIREEELARETCEKGCH